MKKGFTLIELLGVIILLGVIALIAFPIVDNAVKNSSTKSLLQSINNIENAARQFATENKLGYSTEYQLLDLEELKEAGILKDEQIINPETDEPLDGCIGYVWNKSSNQQVFVYNDDCVLPTDESCFGFDKENRTILSYNYSCTKNVVIPGVIGGISVEYIASSAFSGDNLMYVNFDYLTSLKEIGDYAFGGNNLSSLDISRLKSIEYIDSYAFNCNGIPERNFKGQNYYTYDYFYFRCEY